MAYVFLMLAVLLAVVWNLQAQPAPPDPLLQCQAAMRVEQHLALQGKQLSMELLMRAEQAERQLADVRKQLEVLQHPQEAQ